MSLSCVLNGRCRLRHVFESNDALLMPLFLPCSFYSPFGALFCLLYALTAAPAAQPRNAIFGQLVAIVVSLSLCYAKESLHLWLRLSLAVSLTVAVMAKLGITHPPAGASAMIFATGKFDWRSLPSMLICYLVALVCATFFNNFSDKRQYPSFWGIPPLDSRVRRFVHSQHAPTKRVGEIHKEPQISRKSVVPKDGSNKSAYWV